MCWRRIFVAGLVVDLFSGTLESVADITLLGGANALAVECGPGQCEIVQAGSAGLIAAGRYRPTFLPRAQRGTENTVASLVPTGARVMVLDTAVASLPVSNDTHVAIPFTPEGAGLWPFSVAHGAHPWRIPIRDGVTVNIADQARYRMAIATGAAHRIGPDPSGHQDCDALDGGERTHCQVLAVRRTGTGDRAEST